MSKSSLLALLWCVLCGGLGKAAATDFSNVGLGITEANAVVNAIVQGPSSGQLYVGGSFTLVNGTGTGAVTANNIAMWDGLQWNALGQGLNGPVNAICVIGRFIYVGGSFSQTISTSGPATLLNNVAIWNSLASQWFPVGTGGVAGGGVGGLNASVNSLVAAGVGGTIQLLVGGSFSSVNGSSTGFGVGMGNLALYDPSAAPVTFTALGSGTNGSVLSGSVLGNVVASGGTFTMAGPNTQTGITTTLGGVFQTALNALPDFANQPVNALRYDIGGDLYVGGSSFTVGTPAFNSIAVLPVGTTTYNTMQGGVTLSAGGAGTVNAIFFDILNTSEPIIGGHFDLAGALAAENLVQWNPSLSNWVPYIGGTDAPVNAIGEDSYNSIYVGGSFDLATSTSAAIQSAIVRVGLNQDTGTSPSSSATATSTATSTATGASASSSATGTGTTTTTTGTTGVVAVPSSGSSGNSCGLGSSMGVMLVLAMLLVWKRLR